jgi:hypothetical protein
VRGIDAGGKGEARREKPFLLREERGEWGEGTALSAHLEVP